MKIRIRKADKLFRELLLKKRGEVCEKCGRPGRVEVSHFYGRRSESTRYDEDNCDLLCAFCHRQFHENPLSYVEWKKRRLGEKRFKELTIRAVMTKKRDDKLTEIFLKEQLKSCG